jgi:hypothetical protein
MFDYYHIEIHISLQQFDRTLKLPFKILIKKGNDRIENGKKKNEQAVNHDFTKR